MKFFSNLLSFKSEGSEFLYYTVNGKKSDNKSHLHILKKGMSDEMVGMSMSRLRARTGISLADAKILLGL